MKGSRGRFVEQNAEELRRFTNKLNRVPSEVLYEAAMSALITVVEETNQDSGNAAWHWTVTGFRQRESADPRLDFSVKYGQSPIGDRGDKGANSFAVTNNTIGDAAAKLRDMVIGDNRRAIAIYHGLEFSDFSEKGKERYADNANLKSAMDASRQAYANASLSVQKMLTKEGFDFAN